MKKVIKNEIIDTGLLFSPVGSDTLVAPYGLFCAMAALAGNIKLY